LFTFGPHAQNTAEQEMCNIDNLRIRYHPRSKYRESVTRVWRYLASQKNNKTISTLYVVKNFALLDTEDLVSLYETIVHVQNCHISTSGFKADIISLTLTHLSSINPNFL